MYQEEMGQNRECGFAFLFVIFSLLFQMKRGVL